MHTKFSPNFPGFDTKSCQHLISVLPMKEQFVPLNEGQNIAGYSLVSKICETKMSVLFKAQRKGAPVAIKFIKKRPEYAKHIEREVSLIKEIDCPLIMSALDFFDYEDYQCYVMPLADGSFSSLKRYSEEIVKKVVMCGLKALRYLHENRIWHRDVKAENFLTKGGEVFLCDLGLAFRSEEATNNTEYVGTLRYAAPEIITHKPYDASIDIWSLGVTAYTLLTGTSPFPLQPETCLRRCILKAAFCFPSRKWSKISKDAKDLIAKMIVANPGDRISIDEALKSPWFADINVLPKADGNTSVDAIQCSL